MPVPAEPFSLLKKQSIGSFTQPEGGLSQGISGGFFTELDNLGSAPADSTGRFPFKIWSIGISLIDPRIFI
jgi:hypothetical protein